MDNCMGHLCNYSSGRGELFCLYKMRTAPSTMSPICGVLLSSGLQQGQAHCSSHVDDNESVKWSQLNPKRELAETKI